jgi:hypothetical protein
MYKVKIGTDNHIQKLAVLEVVLEMALSHEMPVFFVYATSGPEY